MRRKLLSVVLCVCMMMTMAPFAFAAKESDTSTTNTQEQAPVANSSSSGSGGSTTSVSLPKNNTGNLTISTNNAVLDGSVDGSSNLTYTNGIITVNADNVTIKNLVFGDNAKLVVSTTGKFTLTGCTFAPTQVYNKATDTPVRTAVTLNVGKAVVTNNTFNGVASGYYNAIEFGIGTSNNDLSEATITGNTFNSPIQNNYFNFYNMTEGATIDIESNHFLLANKGSNAIRISNFRNVSGVTFNVNNNEYTYANDSDESQYEGFILLEDYSPEGGTVQDFSGITININNLTSPSNAKQLFYVYDDQDRIIARNQPIVKGDSSISKFCSARIGDTYYASLANAVAAANDNEVIVLKDVETSQFITLVNKTCTVNLNGHTITGKSGEVGTIVFYVGNGGHLNLTGKGTVTTYNGNDDHFTPTNSVLYIDSCPNTTKGAATLIVGEDVEVIAPASNGITVFGCNDETAKPTITINGKVRATKDDCTAISCNGTPAWGNVDITIGETADLSSEKSYVIYFPAAGKLTINGGSIIGDGGIEAKSGATEISVTGNPVITATGTPHHEVNNDGSSTEGYAIAVVNNKNYSGHATVSIGSGYYKGLIDIVNDQEDAEKSGAITITGGYFTSDPTAYLATGKAAVESDLAGYNYKVDVAKNEKADVAAAKPEVSTPVLTGVDKEAATAVSGALSNSTDTVTGDGLTAAASTIANNNTISTDDGKRALESKQITTGTDNTRIVVQTYMDIDITAVDIASKTLTLDITPMYRTVATTANTDSEIELTGADVSNANAVLVGPAGKLIINKPVTIKIPLPTDFVSPVTPGANDYPSIYVQHKGYEYTASVSNQSGTLYATFTNPHGFSSFTITAAPTAVAEVNGTSYINFQDAVDAVENGGTIKALKNIDSTVSGNKRFKVNANEKTVKLIAASGYNLTNSGDTYTVSRQSSGGSISAPTTYAVNVNAATNGAVAADKKTASKGTTVTVTASPSKGYVVDAVKVVDKDGKDVAVTGKDGKYVFTMPGSAVTVTGTFKAETPAPVALPFTDVKSGNWFYDAVQYAYAQGLMTGTSATTFAPNGTMNRAMIVTVLYRLEKSPAVTGASKFTDVPAGQWYSDAVAWAAANKIVNGYDETTFGPMNAVTREQMAAILFRYEQVKGLENVTLEENLNRFPDQNKISAYAIPALQWAVGQKIINGNADGTLDPTGTATRAQVAQIFTNLLNK